MTRFRRLGGFAVLAAAGMAAAVLAPAGPAAAHPLGNFSVNQLAALSLRPDAVEVAVTVDAAELPTLQEGAIQDGERAAYAGGACRAFAGAFEVSIDGERLVWTVGAPAFDYAPGAAGLKTSRLTCRLSSAADLASPSTVRVANRYRPDRIGWRELTATGDGVRLIDPPIPSVSRTGGDLRTYPDELLSSPPDVREATLRVEPGGSGAAAAAAVPGAERGSWWARLVGAAEQRLNELVGAGGRTPLIGVLAVLLALALGAAHAALPGHGKTVMAAYLAGKRGRARDAVAVGAVVTLTHTGGVLVVGLLLTTVAGLAGQAVLGWLGLASGVLITVVGAAMLFGLLRRRGAHHRHHDHHHDHHHHHEPRPSRLGIAAIGVAGGLVPSPSALIVLLGAVGLGRTVFGVLLVLAYGLGMAGTLTAAGLLLVGLQRRWERRKAAGDARWRAWLARLSAAAPAATGSLVLLVGLGLAGRAVAALA